MTCYHEMYIQYTEFAGWAHGVTREWVNGPRVLAGSDKADPEISSHAKQ